MGQIYSLTGVGDTLSHNTRAPRNAKWGVIFFLARRGKATTQQILDGVPNATQYTLGELSRKHVIKAEEGVEV